MFNSNGNWQAFIHGCLSMYKPFEVMMCLCKFLSINLCFNDKIVFMNAERLTISLPPKEIAFVNEYKANHNLKSTSQVFLEALKLLSEQEMYEMFTAMGENITTDDEEVILAGQAAAEDFLDESW